MIKNKIGIMGGTFDPIHLGHLILAEETRANFKLDKVIFIPSGKPPHKSVDSILNARNRYDMTLLATSDNPNFDVSSIEMDRKGTTYTIDTIKYLKGLYINTEFYFITGADSLMNITSWKNSSELLTLCKFVTVKRRGVPNVELEKTVNEINNKYNDAVYLLHIPYIDISSTEIRNRIKNKQSIRYYVPETVEMYIRKNGLYI